jgi:hypothetical protein
MAAMSAIKQEHERCMDHQRDEPPEQRPQEPEGHGTTDDISTDQEGRDDEEDEHMHGDTLPSRLSHASSCCSSTVASGVACQAP